MTWLEAVILGLVQGLTEFLPVSSSGHLVVAQMVLGVDSPGVVLEVVLHLATLVAVLVVYRARVATLASGAVRGERGAWTTIGLLAVASVPAAAIGVLFANPITRAFDSLMFVGVAFLVTGTMLWLTRHREGDRDEPTWFGAGVIGIAQAVAILPGISRSGATIATGIWLRVRPVRSAEFSFLMAIVAIAGAAVAQVVEAPALAVDRAPLMVSFGVALASGIFAIRFLVHVLARDLFYRFAPYCWLLGLATMAWAVAR